MIRLKYVPVPLERFIGVGKASGLLRTPVIINPYEGSPPGAFPLSFRESEQLRYVRVDDVSKENLGGIQYLITLTATGVDLIEGSIAADPGVTL